MDSLIDIRDLSTQEIDELLAVAMDIIADPAKYSDKCRGKKLATLFFEPSTRTRLSFESAMHRLGGWGSLWESGCSGYDFGRDALEAALRICCGKAVVNSVNGEQAVLDRILPIVKKYGAAVVGLTLDETGLPKTADELYLNNPLGISIVYLGFGAGLAVFMFSGFKPRAAGSMPVSAAICRMTCAS